MATREAILAIKVISDTTQAALGLDQTGRSAGRFQSAVNKAVPAALAAGAAVVAIGKKALDSASKLQQSEGAVEAVFGAQANAVKAYADAADTALGLSAAEYNNYAALVGTALQNAGFSVKDSVEESNKVMQRGADLSALYGGTTAEAVEAINAAVSRSEFDPLEKYGVSLNMTAVNAELAAKGQDKLTGAALETAKKQIILEQVYAKSSKAAGQFAKESDSAAGSSQIAAAQWENASAALGEALLPAATAVAEVLADMAGWMQNNSRTAQVLLGIVAGLAVAVLAVAAAFKVWQAAVRIATAVQWLWNAALSANPIGLVIIAIVALVAAIVILWKKSETFRKVVTKVWSALKTGARAAASVVKAVWSVVWRVLSTYVKAYVAAFKLAFKVIRAVVTTVVSAIRSAWSNTIARLRSLTQNFGQGVRQIWQAIRQAFSTVVAALKSLWSGGISALKRAVSGLGALLSRPFEIVKGAIDAVKNAIDKVIGAVGDLISKIGSIKFPDVPNPFKAVLNSAPLPPTPLAATARGVLPAPRVGGVGAPAVSTLAGGGFIQINVSGALDPEGVARQIKRVLGGHERRMGGRAA